MHLSRSHQMFSHRTTILFFGFWTYIDVRYSVNIVIFRKFSQTNLMLHYIAQRHVHAFLIKKSLFAFTDFETRHVCAQNINNMLRDLLTAGSLVPFSHGLKVPSNAIFVSRVITKKLYCINFQPLAVSKLFPWAYYICKKSFETSCLSFAKTKKTRHQKFTFFLQN